MSKKSTAPILSIGVCTYKRLPSLLRTLENIKISLKNIDTLSSIIIVDNDGSNTNVAQEVHNFANKSGLTVHYLIEKTPGISAARNALFAKADQLGVRFVAMLDDDEWPSEGWLKELLETQAETNSVVVGGPVRPVFPKSAENLSRFSRYWSVDKQMLNGRPFVFCTCNFLLDMHAVKDVPRPLFDESFGLTGGGDTVFFRRLFFSGHGMAWSEKAFVYEEVPESRASFKWIRQRKFRVGNHAAAWESIGGHKIKSVIKTIGLTLRLPVYPLFGREKESPMVGWLLEYDKIKGRYVGHMGNMFVEYARPQKPGEKTCG